MRELLTEIGCEWFAAAREAFPESAGESAQAPSGESPSSHPLALGGVTRGARAPAVLGVAMGRPQAAVVLVVLESEDDLEQLDGDLRALGAPPVGRFPSLTEDGDQSEIVSERLWLLRWLLEQSKLAGRGRGIFGEERPVLLATVAALVEPVPSPEELQASLVQLEVGQRLDVDELAERMVAAGFARRARAEVPGEFSVRGGVVDVFPFAEEHPLRLELFDDEIESIRRFESESQRSVERLQATSFHLVPVEHLTQGDEYAGEPILLTDFLDHLELPAAHVWIEPRAIGQRAERLSLRRHDREVLHELDCLRAASLHTLADGLPAMTALTLAPAPSETGANISVRTTEAFRGSLDTSFDAMREQARKGGRIVVFCRNAAEIERFTELLAGDVDAPLPTGIALHQGVLSEGVRFPDRIEPEAGCAGGDLILLSGDAVIGRSAPLKRRHRRFRCSRPVASHLDLRPGDFVVHVSHGIARYKGLESVSKEGRRMEHLVLEFAEGARLLVGVANADLVHRYVGAGDEAPALSKLGGKRWKAKRSKVAQQVMEMAAELLKIQVLREKKPGIEHSPRSQWQAEFEAAFPYEETGDQLKAIESIHDDLGRGRPMDRLLCGDVGYGKTEVAMRAAFRAVDGGYQVAVLVPTTVLCAQHLRTFRERMAAFPVSVEMLSRFQTKRDQKRVIEGVASGAVDIVVGTHRVLSKDITFKNLGLLVIDEEQRFGVKHKEHLKKMRAEIDVLTLSATPIPRTLHMSMMGIRDISTLATPPRDRTPVQTQVVEWSDDLVRKAIENELARDGQVYLVHNRIGDIQELAGHILKLVPGARVGIGHGQMEEKVLARTMKMFVEGEIDVLVSTTIVENGLDIPNANTILIDRADHYGLSELHQLRGRVGRYNRRAYCYLLVPKERALSEIGMKRLKAIEEFADLGAGFDISMRDLEIRGSGNVLGAEQSGHIAAVGYELYCRLVKAAAESLRHVTESSLPPEVPVDLGLDCAIPEEYVPDDDERLMLYTRLGSAITPEAEEQLRAELLDRFGPIPLAAEALLTTARAKAVFNRLGAEAVTPDVTPARHRLILRTKLDAAERASQALQGTEDFVRWTSDRKVMIDLVPMPEDQAEAIASIRALLGLDEHSPMEPVAV